MSALTGEVIHCTAAQGDDFFASAAQGILEVQYFHSITADRLTVTWFVLRCRCTTRLCNVQIYSLRMLVPACNHAA